jgi:hypothetical protein
MKTLGRIGFLLVALSLGTTGWGQAVFNKFGPAAGIQKNTGATYQNTAAAASDVTGLYSGCTGLSTQYLAANSTCQPVTSAVSGANPSASVGLSTVNGSATTYMRSDAAPALSQAIAPTWSGTHTFTNTTANIVLNNSGGALDTKNTLFRESTAGFLFQSATDAAPTTPVTAILTAARTGTAWTAINFGNATDNPTYSFLGSGQVSLTGGVVAGGATGGNKGAGTINAVGLYVGGVAVGTGGGTPGGTTGQLQYNNGGVFGGVGGSTFTSATQQLELIPATGSITALKATSNGTNDVEIVASNAAGADAYFRAVDLSGTNWSFGNQRSSSKFLTCNAVGLSGTCSSLDTSGNFTVPASINTTNGNANINVTGSGQVVVSTTSVATGTFIQGDFCNTTHCLHTLNTTTGQSTPFITNGVSGEAAYIYTDATVPLCLGSAGTCRINLDATGHVSIQTPTSTATAALNISAIAGQYGEIITAPASTGQSVGFRVFAGTNSSDFTAVFTNAAQTTNYFLIDGAGSMYTQGRAAQGAGTLNVTQLYQSDQPIYREVSWAGTCTSGGCTTGISKGTGTVTRNSAGNYSVAFSASFGANAGCTASTWSTLNNGAISTNVASANSSSVTVIVLNTSGTAVDSGFTVVCIG